MSRVLLKSPLSDPLNTDSLPFFLLSFREKAPRAKSCLEEKEISHHLISPSVKRDPFDKQVDSYSSRVGFILYTRKVVSFHHNLPD